MNRALRRRIIPLWWLALAAALSPLLTIHDTFVIAAFEGYISWCIPYWDSCTSISRTGRYWRWEFSPLSSPPQYLPCTVN